MELAARDRGELVHSGPVTIGARRLAGENDMQIETETAGMPVPQDETTDLVRDDGTGFYVAPYRHDREGSERSGIIGMRQRVGQVSGRFS